MSGDEYVAYDAASGEYETFDTFEEAQKWLAEGDYADGAISSEAMDGNNFIAVITHRSKYIITDEKKNYHVHTDTCPENCDEETWPYDSDYENVGKIVYEPVEESEK